MKITLDNGTTFTTFRKPVTFEKIGKRWFVVYTAKNPGGVGTQVRKTAVKHTKTITA